MKNLLIPILIIYVTFCNCKEDIPLRSVLNGTISVNVNDETQKFNCNIYYSPNRNNYYISNIQHSVQSGWENWKITLSETLDSTIIKNKGGSNSSNISLQLSDVSLKLFCVDLDTNNSFVNWLAIDKLNSGTKEIRGRFEFMMIKERPDSMVGNSNALLNDTIEFKNGQFSGFYNQE